MKKMLFIFNPHAGKAKIKTSLAGIIDTFNKGGYEVVTYASQYPMHAKELTLQAEDKYDAIVCCGGDGTLNETVTGIMELNHKPYLGYIPAGSTNDFAASIGLPKDMIRCAKKILSGKAFDCDIGKFNDRYFTYVAAFGAFTEVPYITSQRSKNVFGHQAYVLEAVKQMNNIKSSHMVFRYEDKVIEDDFLFGMISNATSIGGFKGLPGKNVELNDGRFEVMLVRDTKNPLDFPAILTSIFLRNPDPKYIHTFKTSRVEIVSSEPVNWVLDGEFGGNCSKVEIEICHKAISILL
ncbi:MAG: diacylglycerol/lipid kinase family protein [Lachnospiraceae bacterium]